MRRELQKEKKIILKFMLPHISYTISVLLLHYTYQPSQPPMRCLVRMLICGNGNIHETWDTQIVLRKPRNFFFFTIFCAIRMNKSKIVEKEKKLYVKIEKSFAHIHA